MYSSGSKVRRKTEFAEVKEVSLLVFWVARPIEAETGEE